MKKELIIELLQKFEQASYEYKDIECWSAIELQEILGYSQWRNFTNAIEKAKEACKNAGENISDHFADVSKMVELGSGTQNTEGAWCTARKTSCIGKCKEITTQARE